tara:strand:- start:777 stop:908 length:132 start_codon:yes stop_codon:yes gene_type:complete
MNKKQAKTLINMIQLMVGISIASACFIVIIMLVLFLVGTKLGI